MDVGRRFSKLLNFKINESLRRRQPCFSNATPLKSTHVPNVAMMFPFVTVAEPLERLLVLGRLPRRLAAMAEPDTEVAGSWAILCDEVGSNEAHLE
jgi:hypothetical protein